MKHNNNKGFTIIELIIVVIIIIILAGVVVAGVVGYIKKAQATRIITEMNEFKKALTIYHINNGEYPEPNGGSVEGEDAINFLTASLVDSKYISKIPKYAGASQEIPYGYYVGLDRYDDIYCGDISIKDHDYLFIFQNNNLDLNFSKLTGPDIYSGSIYCIGQ